jgi:Flp pilus assembly protein CpaB
LCYIWSQAVPAPKTRTTTLRFTDEDRALLNVLTEKEDRSAGAILRLALRAYAESQGVTAKSKPKPRKPKTAA